MAALALSQHLPRSRVFACHRRLVPRGSQVSQKRLVTRNHLKNLLVAEESWKERATEIKAGRKQSFLSLLEERGFVKQIAGDRDTLEQVLTHKRIGAYCGVDPTAPSLHVGHLLPLMVIFWMYLHGFASFTLLGGATAKVGDPIGRSEARKAPHKNLRTGDLQSMHFQLKALWRSVERMGQKHGFKREWAMRRGLENNSMWLNKLSVTDFLRVMGQDARLGPMLSRDTVKLRLQNGTGMSLSEFTYPLLQAWDWWELYQRHGVQLQVGGSDQFGNIVAGIDAVAGIRKNNRDPVTQQFQAKNSREEDFLACYGLTTPLLTSAAGEKLGKSAGNAIWLDKDLTNTFDLYGYFVRCADDDVERYLRLFTFMPLSEITSIMEEHTKDPRKRIAQHRLAREFVEFVHGVVPASEAASEHKYVFGGGEKPIHLIKREQQTGVLDNSSTSVVPPTIVLPASLVYGRTFSAVLYSAGLAKSKSEGERMLMQAGVYAQSTRGRGASDEVRFAIITRVETPEKYIIEGKRMLLRLGKTNVKFISIVSDEEFEKGGLQAPGWGEEKTEVEKARKVDTKVKGPAASTPKAIE